MDRTNQKKLVGTLIEGSKAGRLRWEPMSVEERFSVSLSKGGIIIDYVQNREDGDDRYTVSVLNSYGVVVETFTDADLDRDEALGIRWFSEMQDLYDLARRKALKSDEVLNDLLQELGTKKS